MSWKKGVFFIFLLGVFSYGCQSDYSNDIPDVSDINIDVKIRRFDQALFSIDTMNMASELQRLRSEYPLFSPIFFDNVLASNDSRVAPNGQEAYIKGFLSHPSVRHLYDTCQVVYPSMEPYKEAFEQAFQFFNYYFPNQAVPDVTTFISEYSFGVFIYGENQLACGLDFFLGENYPYTKYNPQNPNFSAYITRSFNKNHLVAKTIRPLVEDLVGQPRGNRLLDYMIHNGKKLYVMDKLLPYQPDSVIMEVTGVQMEWLENNERDMWAYFLSENLLYSSEWQNIRKLVEYSPNSPGMPPEAPGRTANWMGWQIIKKYMAQNPNETIESLLTINDAQEIMDRSRYKPNR